jgi:hypothetical protein
VWMVITIHRRERFKLDQYNMFIALKFLYQSGIVAPKPTPEHVERMLWTFGPTTLPGALERLREYVEQEQPRADENQTGSRPNA